jgi:sulfate transport system substrate-binding protein
MKTTLFSTGALLAAAALWLWAAPGDASGDVELLNVSYDPTRELWRDVNERFAPHFERQTGRRLVVRQSHGGSSSQARAVFDGLEADVVTLALWSDTDALRRLGLLAEGWQQRLPNRSVPYFSTVVFVVRKGNPLGVHDWPNLVRPGVRVITPSPKTSGNGKLSFLAAWGSVRRRGGTDEEARDFVAGLYRRVPVLDPGARAATVTFAQKKIGDVHLTWENEARLEVAESAGELEVVYPPASIRAEPPVAVVDATVDRKGTRVAAEQYLQFLYTEEAQEIIARHHYRPTHPDVARRHADDFPAIDLFDITVVTTGGWAEAQERFFAEGGVFDGISVR